MSLKKGPGSGLFARNRGIFDELVVMILILILNITIFVNRKSGVGMNSREQPLKIPDGSEFKGNSYVDLAKRTDLDSFGKTSGNVTNVG